MFSNKLNNCKNFEDLSSTAKNSTNFIDSLRFATLSKNKVKECGYLIDLSEIIGHYLNLSFVKPNQDFDGSLGWYNGTHSSGPMKMIAENQVDFILSEIPNEFLTKNMWNPNLYQLRTALRHDYKIGFVVKKTTLNVSILDYLKVFSTLIWILIGISILMITITQTLIQHLSFNKKFNWSFFLNILSQYLSLLLSQSSILLRNFKSFHYVMYFMPLFSVLIINLFNFGFYSNMITPRKQWCQDLNCLINSFDASYMLKDNPTLLVINKRKEWQFKVINSKLTIRRKRGKFSLLIISCLVC